ncbi:hypothetical protein TI39_contig4297g00004 [Zymoseptoria brevis]|uniref:Uncharacterized protein n=1 Tax=Zymoseptoria brevis TaxID=1047168 RepID=A0A0F4G968_9PEZI|nr:hypothetical protein TI39_contig4297g00004 [Zymoseptoria brevis]
MDTGVTKKTFQTSKRTSVDSISVLHWWPEALGWVFSVLIVAAIVVILHAFDGVPTAQWDAQMPITLNAVLSLLVTFLYMALMVPIPKCIAQLKWNHYTVGRPLSDIELFDEASRTVWGSAVLLATRPNRFLAALGALLTLAVAGVGPFVQQILAQKVQPRQLDATTPILPIFNWTSDYSKLSMVTDSDASVNSDTFDAAWYSSIIAPSPQPFSVTPDCASANCTWNPYWTLVVESECSNLTDVLVRNATGWSLPNGLKIEIDKLEYSLSDPTSSETSYGLTTRYPSVAFQDRGYLLSDFFVTASGPGMEGNVSIHTASALECILQLRARRVRAEYKNGEMTETQLGPSLFVNTLESRGCSPWRRLLASAEYDIPNVIDQAGETFFDRNTTQDPLSAQWFSGGNSSESQTSTCNITIDTTSAGSDGTLLFPAIHLLNPARRLLQLLGSDLETVSGSEWMEGGILPYLVRVVSKNPSTQGALNEARNVTFVERVENIAKSFTQTLRSSYFENRVVVAGDAYRDTVIFDVTWYWAIVPASLVLFTFLLLVLTAWDTRHKGLEKRADSSLALMVFGCDQEVRRSLASAGDLAAVTKVAKGTRVRLGPGHVLTKSEHLQFTG